MLSGAALGEALAEQGWKKPTVVHFSVSVSTAAASDDDGSPPLQWRALIQSMATFTSSTQRCGVV